MCPRGLNNKQRNTHIYLNFSELERVITVFNKMDKIDYIEKIYIDLKNKLNNFLKNLGITTRFSIPVSSKIGDNIVTKSKKMSWYSGQTFVEVLDNYKINNEGTSKNISFQFKIFIRLVIKGS